MNFISSDRPLLTLLCVIFADFFNNFKYFFQIFQISKKKFAIFYLFLGFFHFFDFKTIFTICANALLLERMQFTIFYIFLLIFYNFFSWRYRPPKMTAFSEKIEKKQPTLKTPLRYLYMCFKNDFCTNNRQLLKLYCVKVVDFLKFFTYFFHIFENSSNFFAFFFAVFLDFRLQDYSYANFHSYILKARAM